MAVRAFKIESEHCSFSKLERSVRIHDLFMITGVTVRREKALDFGGMQVQSVLAIGNDI
jgi:hypothetical protein